MKNRISGRQLYFSVFALCLASMVCAQNPEAPESTPAEQAPIEKAAVENKAPAEEANKNALPANTLSPSASVTNASVTNKGAKKMVQDATINLQTTVTGNQEQPRVLYILPWQSPAPEDVDFESFSNDQRVVFGHVEREELRRELEAAGEE